MAITQHGPICDLCGEYILLEGVESFSISVSDQRFICHADKCKPVLAKVTKWTDLPSGPLLKAFERLAEEDDAWNHSRPREGQPNE